MATRRPRGHKARRSRSRSPTRRLLLGIPVVVGLVLLALFALDWRVSAAMERIASPPPARLLARPLKLAPVPSLSRTRLVFELGLLGYVHQPVVAHAGVFRNDQDGLILWPRPATPPCRYPLRIDFDARDRVASVHDAGGADCTVQLEAFEFAHLAAAGEPDRDFLPLASIPPLQLAAVLAIEDRNHFRHPGLDPFAILRAAWVNLRAGKVEQGGSTLTQQLAKNLFTGGERSWLRKLIEVMHVLVLEWRYSKEQILEAYLNDLYLGQDGPREIRGVARGARFWFGRPLAELELHHFALLAAMGRGANAYDPRRHPERATERRNQVLDALAELGWADSNALVQARTRALDVTPRPLVHGARFPSLLEPLQASLEARAGREAPSLRGLRVRTGIDPWLQMRAEWAVDEGLARRVRDVPAAHGAQAAVVVLDARTGVVRALVGGRDRNPEGFNRALAARRPIGSLMKPFVALTAFSTKPVLHPASRFDDSPPQLQDANGRPWQPANHDGSRRGRVTLAESMVHSLNPPFVRLALEAGLPRLAAQLERLGAPVAGRPWPSLALGAHGMTPLEVARAYLVFTAGRGPAPVRWIEAIEDAAGTPVGQAAPSPPGAATSPADAAAAAMVRSMLVAVARQGTAQRLAGAFPGHGALAAKTGTTDDRRDSWFVGFGADLLGVTWVGHDDNRAVGLTGAMGALPLWLDVFARHPPAPLPRRAPEGLGWAVIDGADGRRSANGCPGAIEVLLPSGVASGLAVAGCH